MDSASSLFQSPGSFDHSSSFYTLVSHEQALVHDNSQDKPFQLAEALHGVYDIGEQSVEDFARSLILKKHLKQNFFLMHLTTLKKLYQNWSRLMPRVEPFYAVKCNPDVKMIQLLAQLGAGFDCASEEEIRLVMGLGVPSTKIIFANSCKHPSEIEAARNLGVDLTTFDSFCELNKIKEGAPHARALLRIRADDPNARHVLGNKFGAEKNELMGLYETAKMLGVDVVGVSFHIGSGSSNPSAFSNAIALARNAFNTGQQQGFNMSILDIGGGFSSGDVDGDMSTFEAMARAVNMALDEHFPSESGVKIIAEPGRYFMETCGMLATMVIGFKERSIDGIRRRDYWITDGIHGSFNPITVGLIGLKATPLKLQADGEEAIYSGTVFGPTCNGTDIVFKDIQLPKLTPGDWLLFHDMGAYTSALSSNFNGMHGVVPVYYVKSKWNVSSENVI